MKKLLLSYSLFLISYFSFSQNIGIGTNTPDPNALLDLSSSTKGLLIPRTSTTTRLSITPLKGMILFDTVTNLLYFGDGAQWQSQSQSTGNGWLLEGNTGTTSSHFLGTTDNTPLTFKINNTWAGQLGNLNSYYGINAGATTTTGSGNVAVGANSFTANTTGFINTALGALSLQYNITGSENTAVGTYAMNANTHGYLNTAIGAFSLQSNTLGIRNTALGYGAMANNIGGSDNTATGMYALAYNQGGNHNTANGFNSMYSNISGVYNTAVGEASLQNTIATNSNTAIGQSALFNGGGDGNTALGAFADVFNGTVTNATSIGHNTIVGVSNRVRLGNVYVTSVESFGTFNSISDARFKTNIKEEVKGLDFILKLHPVTYQLDRQKFAEFETAQMPAERKKMILAGYGTPFKQDATTHSGFLAQEVVTAMKQSGYDFDGVIIPANEASEHYSIAYGNFTVPLVKAVQEQQKMIEELKKEIQLLKNKLGL